MSFFSIIAKEKRTKRVPPMQPLHCYSFEVDVWPVKKQIHGVDSNH